LRSAIDYQVILEAACFSFAPSAARHRYQEAMVR
jgi:hypothetical protein